MINLKKGQIISELLKYLLVAVIAVFIMSFGYKMISTVNRQGCNTEIAKFEIDLKDFSKNLRFGVKEFQSYAVPCKVDKIYIFDLSKDTNPDDFNDTPIMKDMLRSGSHNNLFLVKSGELKHSFNAGDFEIESAYICLKPKFDKISFFAEGAGKSARITIPDDQPKCN